MARLLWWVLGVPVGIVAVALAVANRKPITLSLDPFRPEAPALSVDLPLYLVVFAVLAIGIVLGGAAAWAGQGGHRRAERRWRDEASRLRSEQDRAARAEREARRAAQASIAGPRKAA